MTCPLFVIPKLRAFLNCHPEITLFLFLVISGSRVSAWDDSILFVISKLFSFLNCHPHFLFCHLETSSLFILSS